MAKIVGAIASSHTPTIGFALDTKKETDPSWLDRFLHDLIIPEHRRKFLSDPETAFEEAGLSEIEKRNGAQP